MKNDLNYYRNNIFIIKMTQSGVHKIKRERSDVICMHHNATHNLLRDVVRCLYDSI